MLTFVTTTSYGSWLPGDARGWVRKGRLLPPDPAIQQHAKTLMHSPAVLFSLEEQDHLFAAIVAAAQEFNYVLRDISIESWHLHWIIQHSDLIETMVGRLKNRMRQSLRRGRIWTEGYCANELATDEALHWARRYIADHRGCRLTAGLPPAKPGANIFPSAPGSAGGNPA